MEKGIETMRMSQDGKILKTGITMNKFHSLLFRILNMRALLRESDRLTDTERQRDRETDRVTESDRQGEYTGTRTGTDGHTDTGEHARGNTGGKKVKF